MSYYHGMMLGVILWIELGLVGFIIGNLVIENSEYRYLFKDSSDKKSLLLSSFILGPLILILTLLLLILTEKK